MTLTLHFHSLSPPENSIHLHSFSPPENPSTYTSPSPKTHLRYPLHVTLSKNLILNIVSTHKNKVIPTFFPSDVDDKLREECGVVGIYGDLEASRLSYFDLEHRGQEGDGIVSVHESILHSVTGVGLVSEVFNRFKLDKFPSDRTSSLLYRFSNP